MDKRIELIAGHFGTVTGGVWSFTESQLEAFVREVCHEECFGLTALVQLVSGLATSGADQHVIYFQSAFECEAIISSLSSAFTSVQALNPTIGFINVGLGQDQLNEVLTMFVNNEINVLLVAKTFLSHSWSVAPVNSRSVIQNSFTWTESDNDRNDANSHLRMFANGLPNVQINFTGD